MTDEQPDPMMADPSGARMTNALRWALDATSDPSMAAADWLALDIDADCGSASGLLSNPRVTLLQLRKAKSAYKTMRIVGETSSDRRLAARLYAASIAAAIVWHERRISGQSDSALRRAFGALLDDEGMDDALRDLAARALGKLAADRQAGAGRGKILNDDEGVLEG
jgi:hypothetical protein